MIIDTFMINDEMDMLECRLVELDQAVDMFVAVEADVDHQDHPKPYHLTDNLDRFAQWADRLIVVQASGLPTFADNPDPWAREHAQREHTWEGLRRAGVGEQDVILHGDIDEIPTAVAARHVRPDGFIVFDQTLLCFAVDWQHPQRWRGTVAARAGRIPTFTGMRDARFTAQALPDAGWHLSWLGGQDAQLRKLGSFCHPEIADRALDGIERNLWLTAGWHVDGHKLTPVDVDQTWPRWIVERHCPPSWFRPRDTVDAGWKPPRR